MKRILIASALVVTTVFLVSISAHLIWSDVLSLEIAVSVAATITSGLSVLFLSLQVFHQARVSEAQLIQALSQDVDQNVLIEIGLDENGALHEIRDQLSKEELAGMISFLTFFERLNTFIELDLISITTFNELYAYRFFLLTHNPNVQNHILLKPSMKESWQAIFRLHKKWVKYRRLNNMGVLRQENAKELEEDAFYKAS